VEHADFDLKGSNPVCGDRIRVTGRVTQGVLTDIAFEGEGCAISKASASLFTERVKGMSLDEVRAQTEADVLGELGVELTPARTKCALLVHQVMQGAAST
jgi:nitrogen fixation protein NifU and related proteins